MDGPGRVPAHSEADDLARSGDDRAGVCQGPALKDRAGLALVVLALGLAFLVHLAPVKEFDLFYHLAIGESILAHHQVPRTGLFSATRGGTPWVDGEYGFQVLAAAVHAASGFPGLALLLPCLPTLALALLGWALARRGLPLAGTALAIGLVTWATGPLTLRPQLLTLCLLPVFVGRTLTLAGGRKKDADLRLGALSCLWANLHHGFILGIVTLAIPTAVEALRALVRRRPGPALRPLALTLTLATALATVNPYGFRQLVLPIEYALRPGLTSFNAEWAPTVLAAWPGFALLLGLGVVALGLFPRGHTRLHEVALFLAFACLGFKALRHVPVAAFAVVFAPASAAASPLALWLDGLSRTRRTGVHVSIAIALLFGALAVKGGLPERHPLRIDDGILLPVEAADFLLRERPAGQLFNQYGFGGYLIWRFRPEARVFVDGRNDLYGEAFMQDYMRVIEGRPGFEEVLDRHGVGTVLVAYHPNNARLLGTLLAQGWIAVHASSPGRNGVPTVVLVRNDSAHAELIARTGLRIGPPR